MRIPSGLRFLFCLVVLTTSAIVTHEFWPKGRDDAMSPRRQSRRIKPQVTTPCLLACPEVRSELELSADQADQVEKWIEDFLALLKRDCPYLAETVNPAIGNEFNEHVARTHEFIRIALDAAELKLQEILTASQCERLYELKWQRHGFESFRQEEIIARLNLTPHQTARINQLPSLGFEPRSPSELKHRTATELKLIFDAQQLATWERLRGEEFEFPASKTDLELRLINVVEGMAPRYWDDFISRTATNRNPSSQPQRNDRCEQPSN